MGRQLASYDNTTYTYNESGIRTSKTVGEDTTEFYLNGTNVIYQTDGTNDIYFFYDRNDEIVGFKYNNNNYFYVKNAMGDITDITDSSGAVVASYTYDPWGKVTSVSGSNLVIADLNPFRYRSYYYDSDIKMYYLQSRYYDPEVGRFINCDDVNYIGYSETINSYNAFAYCENNPVNGLDPNGTWSMMKIKDCVKNVIRSLLTFVSSFLKNIINSFKHIVRISRNRITVSCSLAAFAIDILVEYFGITLNGFMKTCSTLLNFFGDFAEKSVRRFFQKQIVPVMINGAMSKVLTGIRKAIWKAACGVAKYTIGNISSSFWEAGLADTKRLNARLSAFSFYKILDMFSSVGNFICFFMDIFDGNTDEKITISW